MSFVVRSKILIDNGFKFALITLNEEGLKSVLPHMDAKAPAIVPMWVKEHSEQEVAGLLGSQPNIEGKKLVRIPSTQFISLSII
jgi:hypothetical protein